MLLCGIVNELKKSMVKKEYTGRTASPYHNLQCVEIDLRKASCNIGR